MAAYFSRIKRAGRRIYRQIASQAIQKIIGRHAAKIQFDPTFYRRTYPELATFSERNLVRHFIRYGQAEGRLGSYHANRKNFIELLAGEERVLEIGPFTNPTIVGDNVKYFDVLNSEQLARRAAAVGYVIKAEPTIHYVHPDGDLSVVDEKFSCVFSSHCIEHQPDLIRHLKQVENLIGPEGKYYLIVPDKRYCFDRLLVESELEDILEAHKEKRTRHSLKTIIEHRAFTTHNDSLRHWVGDHKDADYESGRECRVSAAIQEYDASEGVYIDAHAWRFTPCSFLHVMISLYDLRYTALKPVKVFNTQLGYLDFCAVLEKSKI